METAAYPFWARFLRGHSVTPSIPFNVTASTASTDLSFLYTIAGGSGEIFLDDVSVTPVGVPDAGSTLPLLGFALLAVAALRRKLSR
jgi:VPDSG-CTERM motif